MLFKKDIIRLGEGQIEKWTIFECKRLFSIYIHRFNTIRQDRFHTHAFNAVSVLIKGYYWEGVKESHNSEFFRVNKVKPGIRYIPRNYNHKLMNSAANSISILFAGPWDETWTETKNGNVRILTWGRKAI